jgi:hypothetical protein
MLVLIAIKPTIGSVTAGVVNRQLMLVIVDRRIEAGSPEEALATEPQT